MDKIIDALLAHNWTFETIFLFGFIFLVVPFKGGESALKTILNHISNKKNQELKLIEVLQQQNLEQDKEIRLLKEERVKDREEITALREERDKDRQEIIELRRLVSELKKQLHNLGS